MQIILLSGGSGKRLWPLSNDIRSKQFIKIFKTAEGEYESMVQRVFSQIKTVDPEAKITIATSKSQVSAINNQLGDGTVGISVEPCRRDTFPAIALATAYLHDVMGVREDEPVVVCPVDPYVNNDYYQALKRLSDLAEEGVANLTLMGIEPTYPSEKYGYIIPENHGDEEKVLEMVRRILAPSFQSKEFERMSPLVRLTKANSLRNNSAAETIRQSMDLGVKKIYIRRYHPTGYNAVNLSLISYFAINFDASLHWLLGLDNTHTVLAASGKTEEIMDLFCFLPEDRKQMLCLAVQTAMQKGGII